MHTNTLWAVIVHKHHWTHPLFSTDNTTHNLIIFRFRIPRSKCFFSLLPWSLILLLVFKLQYSIIFISWYYFFCKTVQYTISTVIPFNYRIITILLITWEDWAGWGIYLKLSYGQNLKNCFGKSWLKSESNKFCILKLFDQTLSFFDLIRSR